MSLSPERLAAIITDAKRVERLPDEELITEAWQAYFEASTKQRIYPCPKPRIRVMRCQGKPLLILRIGRRFVSSFTWRRLLIKLVLGQSKRVAGTTLEKRWKE